VINECLFNVRDHDLSSTLKPIIGLLVKFYSGISTQTCCWLSLDTYVNDVANHIKFISSKPKYKITQTKTETIQLVIYGVIRKVLNRH